MAGCPLRPRRPSSSTSSGTRSGSASDDGARAGRARRALRAAARLPRTSWRRSSGSAGAVPAPPSSGRCRSARAACSPSSSGSAELTVGRTSRPPATIGRRRPAVAPSRMKATLLYDVKLWKTSGHWEKFRDDMFLVPGESESQTYGLKPMNCPGHMLLFGGQRRSYRELPLRYAESSTLHRNELTGALHGLLRVRHVDPGRRPHLLLARPDRGRDLRRASTTSTCSTASSESCRQPRAHRLRPDNKLGSDEELGCRRGGARVGAEAPRHRLRHEPGRGCVLRAEDRPCT